MDKISILGCGWLGLPLGKALVKDGFSVNASTTSPDKIPLLENSGLHPFIIELKETAAIGNLNCFLHNATTLVIDIPPKLRGENAANFVLKIQNIVSFIEKSTIENVLFISSTAVFADENNFVTETTVPNPETGSGIQLLATEKLLQQNTAFRTTVLRFSGLIGDDRHPIRSMAGRDNLENPLGPVNLIHQDDCIAIIQKIITYNFWGETLNATSPQHPQRQAYYIQKAIDFNLPVPQFIPGPASGKTIDATPLIEKLGYTFLKEI
ncbi:MAG TPA: SDR family NAD(P)-dependent oxidoreductase [Flavobacterium sp.]|jgi:nucleoside-diphosphate-sugar epimerase